MARNLDLAGSDLIVNTLRVGATRHGETGTSLSSAEAIVLDSVTPGTAAASKAVVLGASKDIATITSATITTLSSTDIDAGASGTAGSVDVFPTTASKGKLSFVATASTGDTTTTVTNALQATTRTYTIPDAGASASFVMTAGAQTIAGAKTFSSAPIFSVSPTLGAGTTIDLDSATSTLSSNAATLTKYAAVVTTESLTTAAGASQALTLTLTGVAATDLAFCQRAGGTNTRVNFALQAISTSNTVTVTVYNNEPTNALNGTIIFNIWILKS